MFRLAFFAGLVVYVAAQSQQCISALINIAGNNDANRCLALNITLVEPLITAVKSDTSIVRPLNTWLSAVCSAPPCSNATIAAVVTNLTAGCSDDFNIPSDATLIPKVQSLYPTIRKILCLRHGGNLCITETLSNVETVAGPLTVENIAKISTKPPSFPVNITCTDCNKAAYSILAKDVPSIASAVRPALQTCGASFLDGSTPSTVT